jgi:hypothetical protein
MYGLNLERRILDSILYEVSLIYYVCRPQCNVYQLVKLASKHFVVDVHDVPNQLKYIMLLKVLILKYEVDSSDIPR